MLKIKLDKLEYILDCKIKKRMSCVGLDTAQRSGISFIKTTDDYVHIDWMFIEFKESGDRKQIYKTMINTFENLFEDQNFATIEEVFVGFNRAGSVELARYGSYAISACVRKNIDYELISAVSCRSKFGIKTSKKAGYGKGQSKKAVSDWLKKKLGIDVEDEDISDAIILGLCGIIEGMDFEPKGKKKKT